MVVAETGLVSFEWLGDCAGGYNHSPQRFPLKLGSITFVPPRHFEHTIPLSQSTAWTAQRTRLSFDHCDATFELSCSGPRGRAGLGVLA